MKRFFYVTILVGATGGHHRKRKTGKGHIQDLKSHSELDKLDKILMLNRNTKILFQQSKSTFEFQNCHDYNFDLIISAIK